MFLELIVLLIALPTLRLIVSLETVSLILSLETVSVQIASVMVVLLVIASKTDKT